MSDEIKGILFPLNEIQYFLCCKKKFFFWAEELSGGGAVEMIFCTNFSNSWKFQVINFRIFQLILNYQI